MAQTTAIPRWFYLIVGLALIWNLLGLMAFFMQINMSPEVMASLPDAQQRLYAEQPAWVNWAFGGAVIFGVIGCMGLIFRKRWALPVLILSLADVALQQSYFFFLSDTFAVMGQQAMIMPLLVILVAVFLVWFAYLSRKKVWIH